MRLENFKFRIYDYESKSYLEPIGLLQDERMFAFKFHLDKDEFELFADCEVELFTGIKDTHNRPIYENDIVAFEWNHQVYECLVKYDTQKALFRLIYQKLEKHDVFFNLYFINSSFKLEIISNLHDERN